MSREGSLFLKYMIKSKKMQIGDRHMDKVKKFVSDYQDQISAALQLCCCMLFLVVTAGGAVKKERKKGKK
jgi:hypothetical protein